ncbi:MAG: AMP-dependent synthetase/ligase, partial [Saprospiraceae bacterium]|nr:AMP-dependent synthetase/ligase [Saprospiraceae bacterium]
TGDPKGAMLTHQNIISNIEACLEILPVGTRHHALSFLPLNHVFERMLNYLYMSAGLGIYYVENIDTIADDIRKVKPHIFTTVPRLIEKVYEKITEKGEQQRGIKRWLFDWSLKLAKNYELSGNSLWYKLQHRIADALIYGKWRAALGGEIICIVSGGAALNPTIARAFTAAGIPVLEGYGLTETSPVIAVNRMDEKDRKFGSVGKVIDNVEVKLGGEDEILCRGPNIMKGYYNKPEKTEEVIEEDGWFHTGDIGDIDEEGFLSITDRKKSVFKTSGGKYVAPQRVENTFSESSFIDNIMVVGEGRKMVTAVIQPNFEKLKSWFEQQNFSWDSKEEAVERKEVREKFEEIVDECNQGLNHTEQVKEFVLVPDEWTVEGGELTPTRKLKRRIIEDKYEGEIEEMYKN